MRTIAYIDGYNLYYGLIKRTNYKWLDLHSLFSDQILRSQSPESRLELVKYFTADIKSKFASRGSEAFEAQQKYHRALESPHTSPVKIIKGQYTATRDTPMAYQEPPNKTVRVDAWKLEEKQTDVSMAIEMYRDAAKGIVDHIVVCSNDSDLGPALEAIRADFPHISIGMVSPLFQGNDRYTSKTLSQYSHWTRRHIREDELKASTFPNRVPTRRKPVDKPDHW